MQTGFNPEAARSTLTGVQAAYNEFIQAIGTSVQSKFIGGMSQRWACNSAIEYFRDTFKPSLEAVITDANTRFSKHFEELNDSATKWASQTGSTFNKVNFTPNNFKYDISVIRENINGVRGIDKADAMNVVRDLQPIKQAAEAALTKASNVIVQYHAFYGEGQDEALVNSINRIKSALNSAFEEQISNIDRFIQKTITDYEDTAGRVAQNFSSAS